MFRRFGIINPDNSKMELLLNLNQIASIYYHQETDATYISLENGNTYKSEISYEHLAAALDGVRH